MENSRDQLITNTNQEDKVAKQYPIYFYEKTNIGPFFVYIDNLSSDVKSRLNPIKVGEIIFHNHPELDSKISNIEAIGRNRIRIKFSDYINANKLLRSNALNKFNLHP